jgi:rubrerythrin
MRDAGMKHLAEEFESIGKEEREQYELLAVGTAGRRLPEVMPWEYSWHYLGAGAGPAPQPRTTRDLLHMALASERRTMNFYADVAEHVDDDAVSALAAEMATDEKRHVERLERLLAREPDPATLGDDEVEPIRPTRGR